MSTKPFSSPGSMPGGFMNSQQQSARPDFKAGGGAGRGTGVPPHKPLASVSLDLDDKWTYMKTHGDARWESFPSYLETVVPRVLRFLGERSLRITFFIVGQDAALARNGRVLRSIAEAGHEVGNHSFHHEPWLHLYSRAE